MRRGRRTTVVVCLILFSFVSGTLGFLSLNVSALTPHDEIVIDGDNDFIPANGVVGGNGTPSNPYIIEGWEIEGYTGISISNSQVHFIIRDVYINSRNFGITLTNVNNGRIENATIDGPHTGMQVDESNGNSIADSTFIGSENTLHIMGSDKNIISNNEFSGYGQWDISLYQSHENMVYYNSIGGHRRGMYITESNDNRVSHNLISGGSWGMTIQKSLRNTISHNTFSPSVQVCIEIYGGNIPNSDNVFSHNLFNECPDAIYASQLQGSEFSNNTFTNSTYGIHLSYSNGNDIFYNTATDNNGGFYLRYSNDNVFVGNELITNNGGISITNSDPNIIYHNNFLGNSKQAYDDGTYSNRWDAGYPAGGNYWSDYSGFDNCSGPLQDICPDPDGIGDTPYVDGHVNDRYPLIDLFLVNLSSPPTKPLNLQAEGNAGSITLTWERPSSDGGSPITNYHIYRGIVSGGETFLYETGNVLSYVDKGLKSNQTYFYQVTAVNAAGEGSRSNEADATPNEPPNPTLKLTPHDPIRLNSDDDFKHVHGITGGSGTYSDPYIIEGWSIDASTATGINISYANVCFEIRNTYIYGGGPSHFGVSMSYAACGGMDNVTITNNQMGVYMYRSSLAAYRSNITLNLREGIYGYESSVHVENSNLTFNGGSGLVSTWTNFYGVVIESNIISNGGCGVAITGGGKGYVNNNNVSLNSDQGILAEFNHDNPTILGNTVYKNGREGLWLFSGSRDLRVENNTLSYNKVGMTVEGVNNQIADNVFLDNEEGIHAWYSRYNTFSNNTIIGSGMDFIIESATWTTLTENKMSESGIVMMGTQLRDWNTHSIDATNTVRGTPVYYLSDSTGGTVPTGFAQIILGNCTGMTIENQNIENVHTGIILGYSDSNVIMNNTLSGNYEGIKLAGDSRDNLVHSNTLENNGFGVITDYLTESNIIYHNTFVDNGGDERSGANQWDNGYPSGGNYWSDYNGVDNCSGPNQDICPDPDGIGDIPHTVDYNALDRYPLMAPHGRIIFNPPFSLEAVSSGRSMGDVDIRHTRSRDDGGSICALNWPETLRSQFSDIQALRPQPEPLETDEIQKLEITRTQNKFQCLNVHSAKRN